MYLHKYNLIIVALIKLGYPFNKFSSYTELKCYKVNPLSNHLKYNTAFIGNLYYLSVQNTLELVYRIRYVSTCLYLVKCNRLSSFQC